MSAAYILCKVFPGLFDTEYYVTVNGSSAYYVNRDNVKVSTKPDPEKGANGQVLAYIVKKEKGKTLVQLSGEAVLGGLRTWVSTSEVSPVAR
jgi:hypothetical protein